MIVLSVAGLVLASLPCNAAVADFARTHLGLDLTSFPFGSPPERFSEYERVVIADVTYLYGKPVPDRNAIPRHQIILKFVHEKLVEISIGFSGKEQNDELVRQFTRMSGIDPKKDKGTLEDGNEIFSFQDSVYQVAYKGMCSPRENSVAVFKFTAVKTP